MFLNLIFWENLYLNFLIIKSKILEILPFYLKIGKKKKKYLVYVKIIISY
jgi:hypothetical protein